MPYRTVRETVPSDARLDPYHSDATRSRAIPARAAPPFRRYPYRRTRLPVRTGPVARRAAVKRVPNAHVGACASYAFNHATSPPKHRQPYKPSRAGTGLPHLGPATLFTPGMIGSRLALASAQLEKSESV